MKRAETNNLDTKTLNIPKLNAKSFKAEAAVNQKLYFPLSWTLEELNEAFETDRN